MDHVFLWMVERCCCCWAAVDIFKFSFALYLSDPVSHDIEMDLVVGVSVTSCYLFCLIVQSIAECRLGGCNFSIIVSYVLNNENLV